MKVTGIVRRVDDLGRIAIPKEIRRRCNIREGDALELFLDYNPDMNMPFVCFQRYEAGFEDEIRRLFERMEDYAEYGSPAFEKLSEMKKELLSIVKEI